MINILNAHTHTFNTLQTSKEYFNKACDTQENQRQIANIFLKQEHALPSS